MVDAPRHFRIFISSPGDVAEERKLAREITRKLQDDPLLRGKITTEVIAWEDPHSRTAMLATLSPQEAINAGMPKPADCDIVVVMLWARIGTPLDIKIYHKLDGSPYFSGTEWEYENAMEAARKTNKPMVLVYRRTEKLNLDPDAADFDERADQYKRVKEFFNAFRNPDKTWRQSYTEYEAPKNFGEMLEADLKSVINTILTQPINQAPPPLPKVELWQGSPFPGLRAFTTSDAPIYFGRGNESEKLMRRVAERGFVAVVGASGSGKSSLVGAGLIPRLKAGGLEGSEHWLLPDFRDGQWNGFRFTPGEVGDNPFMALAAKCAALHGMRNPQFAEKLEADPQVLVRLCLKAVEGKPDAAKVLIFIDQFEELFTVVDAKYREPFINMLDAAATEERLRVVVTTRSDFYDRCLEWQLLTNLLENGQYPVSTPDAFFLKDMIEKPAERAGLTFEEGLPVRMVQDTGSDAGALALLAYALDELYKVGDLTHAAYEKLGKVEGAIGTRAAAIYGELKPEVQGALAEVFGKLVTVNVEGTPTRRRALLADFTDESNARQLIHALADARLLVTDGKTVEVAHEALFRKWPTLVDWIAEYKSDLYVIEQVKQAAKIWDEYGRNYNSYGWKHDRLKPVYDAQNRLKIRFDTPTENFIQPEAKRLLEEFRNAPEHKRLTLIEEDFARLGEDGLDQLINALVLTIDDERIYRRLIFPYAYSQNKIQRSGNIIFGNHLLKTREILTKLLGKSDFRMRVVALDALGELRIKEAIPNIIDALLDVHKLVRWSAITALGDMKALEAIPNIIEVLSDTDERVRAAAVNVLGEMKAKEAISDLIRALLDKNEWVRARAVNALAQLREEGAIPNIIRMLSDSDAKVRVSVVEALEELKAQEAIPELIIALSDPDAKVRASIVRALEALRAQEAIPELIIALSDPDLKVREFALEALSRLNAQQAIPNIAKILLDPNPRVSKAALIALQQIGTPEAVKAILEWRIKKPRT